MTRLERDIDEQGNAAIRGMEGKMTVEAGADKEMIASKWGMNKAGIKLNVEYVKWKRGIKQRRKMRMFKTNGYCGLGGKEWAE